ncbi:dTDP-4-dehydrorhamnose 3,5-epimerase [Prochlorococcus sp. AH-716-E17]|nr:dTDP-4-dehydrorhamnose 3,5-epimerase [Prochlorococcus sp. AH-716-E17]
MKSEIILNQNKELIEGPLILKPKIFKDERGYFYESFNQEEFNQITKSNNLFVQDNISYSILGVLRGLHYQLEPKAQGKLVKVLKGEIYDVFVDLRKSSSTFLSWFGIELNQKNNKQLWIPKGFAHGFLTLSDNAIVEYKVDNFWSKENERSLIWDDELINIKWPLKKIKNKSPKLSKKDLLGKTIQTLQKSNGIFK